jgi:hypothetical protein
MAACGHGGPRPPGNEPALDISGPGMAQQLSSDLMYRRQLRRGLEWIRGALSRRLVSSTVVEHVGADGQTRGLSGHNGHVCGCRRNCGADHSRSCDTERKDRRDDKGSPDAHDSSTTTTGAGRVRLPPVGETLEGYLWWYSISKREISDHYNFCYLMKKAAKVPLFPA